jgi:bleomycin hydrolase
MTMKKLIIPLISCILLAPFVSGQNRDKAVFRESKPGFYQNSIMKDDREVREKAGSPQVTRTFSVDLAQSSLPNKTDLYKKQWHTPPVSQGNTSTCWSFSTTSFLESEAYRISKQQVKLSEMYTVYWEYIEKAKRYVRERGNSAFAEGSEANAVTRMWKLHGIVPLEFYTGLTGGRKYHNHEDMFNELSGFLASVKANSLWNEEYVTETIKSIMNQHMGVPPAEITVNGKKMTPLQYLTDVLRINPDDYVDILSYRQEPFYRQVEYKVPDNWWHSDVYYNIPLDEFMAALKNAVRKGFTVSIGGDVSEPGLDRTTQCAVIPDFDIPAEYINDDARQFRFSNHTTTDDHGMHIVGYTEKDGKDWYMLKDSGAGSKNNDPKTGEWGYYFFSEGYVKLKMMDFMVHKDAVKDVLTKF